MSDPRVDKSMTVNPRTGQVAMESVADRTKTHAVVDNNIQASSKDISVQLSTLLPLTTDYRMRHRTNCRRRTTNAAVTVYLLQNKELS